MKNKPPCHGCKYEHQDKNQAECRGCDARYRYASGLPAETPNFSTKNDSEKDMIVKTKTCEICGKEKPANIESFDQASRSADGLTKACKDCRDKTGTPAPDECANCEDGSNFIHTDLQPEKTGLEKLDEFLEVGKKNNHRVDVDEMVKYDPKSRYYDHGGIEVLDIIKAKLTPEQYQGFCLGNAIKYTCRANHKGDYDRDLEKAEFYAREAR